MNTKVQIYSQMADHVSTRITSSRERWTSFLDTAAKLYKYPFPEQLMIFAQRPDATACATFDTWNEPMNRWIKRGAKGIALIDNTGTKPRLKYVFDVSDTEDGRRNTRRPFLWEMRQEHETPVIEALAKTYDSDAQGDLGNMLYEIAAQLASGYYDDNRRDIEYSFEGSYLEGYDEFIAGAAFREALTVSTAYSLMSRCGIDTADYFEDEDYQPIFDFNTSGSVYALGTAVSELSEQVLRNIEITIKNYERQKNAERSAEHGELDVQPERGLSDTRPDIDGAAGRTDREIRDNAPELPDEPQKDIIQHPAVDGAAIPAPIGDRTDGEPAHGTAYAGTAGEKPGSRQGERTNEVGGAHERLESDSGRTDIIGADSQLSIFPTEKAQREAIAQKAAEQAAASPIPDISDAEIDALLCRAVENPDVKLALNRQFKENARSREASQMLKEAYSGLAYTMPRTDEAGGYIGLISEDKGVTITKGEAGSVPLSQRQPPITVTIPWPKLQKRVSELVQAGRFLTADELARPDPADFVAADLDGIHADLRDVLENSLLQKEHKTDLAELVKAGATNDGLTNYLSNTFPRESETMTLTSGETADYFTHPHGISIGVQDRFNTKFSFSWSEIAPIARSLSPEWETQAELDFDTVAKTALERVMLDADYIQDLTNTRSRAGLRNPCTWALEQSIRDHEQDEPAVFNKYFSDFDWRERLFDYVLKESYANRPQPEQAAPVEPESEAPAVRGRMYDIGDTVYLQKKPYIITDIGVNIRLLDAETQTSLSPVHITVPRSNFYNRLSWDERNKPITDYFADHIDDIDAEVRQVLAHLIGPDKQAAVLQAFADNADNLGLAYRISGLFTPGIGTPPPDSYPLAGYTVLQNGIEITLDNGDRFSLSWLDMAPMVRGIAAGWEPEQPQQAQSPERVQSDAPEEPATTAQDTQDSADAHLKQQIFDELYARGWVVSDELIADGLADHRGRGGKDNYKDIADYIEAAALTEESVDLSEAQPQKDAPHNTEPVQADVWYRVGDTVYYDDTEYEIIEINLKGGYISLLDPNNRNRHESPGMFNKLLLTDERNQQLRRSRENAEPAATTEAAPTPLLAIADYVKSKLEAGEKFTSNELFAEAAKAYGDTMANNAFTSKDAYDAMELGVNQYVLASDKISPESMLEMLDLLPTQTRRTAGMEKFQQFSTPPSIAYLANYAANVTTKDIMLEPSAGNGGIAVFAKKDGAAVYVNELDKRRLEVIKNLPFDGFFNEDAEQINNIHGDKLAPTVIVMNPPFSSSAERNIHDTKIGAKHIEEALKMLAPNGRLVAVVGQGMAEDAPAFRAWWKGIKEQYNVKANIGIDGKNYNKYGTNFGIQMLVIDKDGPTIAPVKTAFVENLLDMQSILEGIRNDRPSIEYEHDNGNEQKPVTATRLDAAVEREPERRPNDAVLDTGGGTDTAAIRNRREQTGTSKPATAVRGNPGDSPGLANVNDDGATSILDAERHSGNDGRNDGDSGIGRTGVTDSGQSAGSVKPVTRQAKPVKTELTDSIFEQYQPQPLLLENVQPHPANISESAAMSAIEPPPVTYKPSIGQDIIKNGILSDVQLEAVTYAGQSHSQTLPGGNTRGFFLGDGTGVGKGRTITGIILDNYVQGRKKAVWLSENRGLVPDAKRDVKALFGNSDLVTEFQGGKKADASLGMDEGILFTTYSALSKGFDQSDSNYEKIVNWLGKDFDGVIVFDEAHNMANSIATKGNRGVKKASQRGMAGLAIQEALPKAKIVYSSATGATEVENLRYAERLGLWGEGTAFPNGDDFVHKIKAGGLAAMELIARDMKAMGVYLSRNISYEDVVYDKIVHELTPEQRKIYDELARSWQIVFQNLNKALETTNQKFDGTAKGKAYGAFWSAEQRFFNQILTAMQVPSMITDIQKQLDDNNSIVIQLVSTNEAAQEREFSRLQEQDLDLDDFDLTPKQMLMSYIENSFPTVQFEEYTDDNGNVKSKPVFDSEGNPVINREAVRQKEMLLDKLGSIKVPASALDMIINHFGSDMVAENTGRKRRVVVKDGKAREENISHKKEADVTAFQNGDKRIIVFSKAGGTGKSYHADKSAKNQQHRVHYLLQAGWQADAAVQGFGRSHRSNQVSSPTFALVTTDLKGQMRFISTIAKRLDQLGALTKGQRQTGSQGLFTAGDNLENAFAADVLALFYKALIHNNVHGVPNGISIIDKLGLRDKVLDEYGQLNPNAKELREVNKFLNRILSLESSEQNAVFDGYADRLQAATERALQDGTLDKGLENYRADKIVMKEAHDIRVDETTGATTKYYSLTAHHKIKPLRFNQINTQHHSFVGFYQNENTGAVRAVFKTSSSTDEYGIVTDNYRLTGQDGNEYIPQNRLESSWEQLTPDEAKPLWNDAVNELPEFRTNNLHLIGGTVLPVWDKLPTENVRIYRVLTSDGDMLIGRVIPENMIDATLYKLGATREKDNIQTEDLIKGIKNGDMVHLENGWRITQRRVSNEQRIEIIGPDYLHSDLLTKKGVFTERIAYQTRYFVPAEKDTIRILDDVIKISPVSRVENSNEQAAAKSYSSVSERKQPERVSAKGKPSILDSLKIPPQTGGGPVDRPMKSKEECL